MIPVALITALIAGAVSGVGAWTYQANKYEARIATIRRDQAIAAHKQLEVVHAQTIALQAKADTAARKHAARQSALANAVASARATADGLRNDLSAARVQLSSAPCTSVRQHAATLNELFGQCTAELGALAGQADGHAADSLMLQEAWPVKSER